MFQFSRTGLAAAARVLCPRFVGGSQTGGAHRFPLLPALLVSPGKLREVWRRVGWVVIQEGLLDENTTQGGGPDFGQTETSQPACRLLGTVMWVLQVNVKVLGKLVCGQDSHFTCEDSGNS